MNTITVLTATRAEYGLLRPVIKALKEDGNFVVKIAVTGAHLSPEFGLTYKEILADGFEIDKKIEILLSADTPASISKSMGLAMQGFADYFADDKPDALLVLGDRYETIAVCLSAMNECIPIIHLHGGETTEGAIDEAIRHCITKLSHLHLTSADEHRRRVIQLGENPDNVIVVGATGVENALHSLKLAKQELEAALQFSLERPYAVVTFHPVTLEENSAGKEIQELLAALDRNDDLNYIITKANADSQGRIINEMITEYASGHANVLAVDSLGTLKYLSALKYASMVIGNSSSGLIEAPSFKIPTINIGNRQRGRLRAASVIDCEPIRNDICDAIQQAKDEEFRRRCREVENPYGDGNASQKIAHAISQFLSRPINIQKKFYDLESFKI